MELVADRFVMQRDGGAIDLATGLRVFLRVAAADPAGDVRWSARCDAVARMTHAALAPLVDYGALGKAERFEAWQCGPPWSGADAAARAARADAAEFLGHTGLVAIDGALVRVRGGAPVIVPAIVDVPDPTGESPEAAAIPLARRGFAAIDGAPLGALAEMFRAIDGPRLHAAAIWGPPGSGRRALIGRLARVARLHGFVPVAAPLVNTDARALWRGRSLFVIDIDGGPGWPAVLDVAIASPLPHAVIIASDREVAGIHGVALRPLTPEQLLDAIRPRRMASAIERGARHAAERAAGWPGRFVRLLLGADGRTHDEGAPAPRSAFSRVAEQATVYGGDERAALPASTEPRAVWAAPGDLASLRRRVVDAERQLAAGRHAAAIRLLRQASAAFARRDCWVDAASASLQLARTLLRRGHARDAESAIDEARQYAARTAQPVWLVRTAIAAGHMWIDRARLDEAESILAPAVAASIAADDSEAAAHAGLAMARCLFWRGRYDEAFAAADRVDAVAHDVAIHRQRRRALIVIARGDTAPSLQIVTDLLTFVDRVDAHLQCAILTTAALAHLAAGDAHAAAAHGEQAMQAAVRAHEPLRGVQARIVLAEAERRRGAVASASAHLQRLARLARSLPPLLQAQLKPAERAKALPPLALLLPPAEPAPQPGLPIVGQVIAIVRACQTAEDELVVLRDVCARVRQQLSAAATAFVIGPADRLSPLVSDGARAEIDLAARALDAGIVLAPQRLDDRVVAAAPIQYGGASIGALTARWTLGSTAEQSHAAAVLATTAVAAAPILSAALARRERVVATTGRELLGAAASMEQVRRLIDRAASAPFSVLVDGESGSGKELVAKAIHRGSSRRDRPFRTLNCAAIPDDLAEAELFGHVRGSFTGAVGDRTGVFEETHGGTLFLDEVGELSPRAQAKLLRVLQEGEVRRVGENIARRVDVRVVAATNRDLRAECEAGRFRFDLFYRLDVIRISMPPLRERSEDIPLLVDHFWREATGRVHSRATLSASTIAVLARYHWPGNVRELQNVLAALAVRCPKRGVVPPSALPPSFAAPHGSPAWRLEEARRTFEERFVRAALARSGGHRARAAAELGVTRQGLTKLMSRLGIS